MLKAWDKNHKCFWEELPIGYELKLNGKIFLYDMPTNEMELVRKTGLQDVASKDIYEGDIVEFNSEIFTVKFYNGTWIIESDYGFRNLYLSKDCKIVGNIYENKDRCTCQGIKKVTIEKKERDMRINYRA